MTTNLHEVARKLLHVHPDELSGRERHVVDRFLERKRVSRNTNTEFSGTLTFSQKVADRVMAFGGSWPFIGLFLLFLVAWILLNTVMLARRDAIFDPYPFILLNLFLSMLAAVQAPVILMSQNRQSAKDRVAAEHDYEVNLKAELEIMTLHEKLDGLRERQWAELGALQTQQISLLEQLLSERGLKERAPESPEGAASNGTSIG